MKNNILQLIHMNHTRTAKLNAIADKIAFRQTKPRSNKVIRDMKKASLENMEAHSDVIRKLLGDSFDDIERHYKACSQSGIAMCTCEFYERQYMGVENEMQEEIL